ncbi:MAG: hypothetical protein A2W29_00750 [Gemmatimonadetes bacterium RBG_16_66_8]|nr:MAG: hypothetical protein A2W29_00750 [Gemmatimonadetes bacterium RBG_16_66_8]
MFSKIPRSSLATIGAIATAALVVRVYGIDWGLPLVNEEASPLKTAWHMWGWGPERGLDLNPHFFKYPSLTIYLQFLSQGLLYVILSLTGTIRSALDFRLLYVLDPTPFYVMGRLVTVCFGAATVVPTYLVGRRVAGPAAGAMAALLVALNVPLISKSQVVEVDVPLTCLVTVSLLMALRLADRPGRATALVTGLTVGLAAASKYPGLFTVVPAITALVLGRRTRPGAGTSPPAKPPRRSESSTPGSRDRQRDDQGKARSRRSTGESSLSMSGLLLLGIAAGLVVASPFLILDAGSFWGQLAEERQHMRLGHFGVAQGWSWSFYAIAWFESLVGWPLGVTSLIGAIFFVLRRRAGWAWVLGTFVVIHFAVVGSWSMKADRYLLPLIPVGAIFASALIWQFVAGSDAMRRSAPARIVVWLGAFALLVCPQLLWAPGHIKRFEPDSRALAKEWIEANVPAGSFILCEVYGPELLSPGDFVKFDAELATALCSRNRKPIYALQLMPMFQVAPERSEDFYDMRFLQLADYVVVTGSVRDRYRAEPSRFPRQVALYDTLERRYTTRHEVKDAKGSAVTIYRNPLQTDRFAARAEPGPVPTLDQRTEAVGGEAFYYYSLGLNLEAYGFVEDALSAYTEGMRFGFADRASMMSITRAIVRCHLRLRRPTDALRFLAQQMAQPRPAVEVARLRQLRREVSAGTFALQALSCPSP